MPWPKGRKRPEGAEVARKLMSSPEHQARLIAGRVLTLQKPGVLKKYVDRLSTLNRSPEVRELHRQRMTRLNHDPAFQAKAQAGRLKIRANRAAAEVFVRLAFNEGTIA